MKLSSQPLHVPPSCPCFFRAPHRLTSSSSSCAIRPLSGVPSKSLETLTLRRSFRMNLRSIHSHSNPQVTFFPRRNFFSSFRWIPGTRDSIVLQFHRRWRSRRPLVVLRVRASLDDLFRDLISVFPSPTSLDLLFPPAIGLAAGVSLYFSYLWNRTFDVDAVVGDWVLFSSPTPFNRSVLLRCPSVSFEDGGVLLEGVNDRLLREDRHYVNLSRGRIPVSRKEGENMPEEEIQYQRLCLRTDDGGVISLDWPENLELRKEHGLDTTVLIVPGTPEGSMGRCVKAFVFDALQHGYFPIVMNPRGCAGSPLTTPRIFTAADSDDILTAIQFVSTVRPWTTMMSIGWGYGANMLTKYLADAGDSTVLTAAVCIDNTFDLDEATRSFPHHITLDQKLTSGLVNILQSNKELFQGKAKGFDIQTALLAKSVRDFDQSISMVSHGYHKVEEFYSMASTGSSIGNLKIPVLFVQTDDGTVPSFSIPRGSIAENPFTSLILCSYLPSTINAAKNSAAIWCQQLAIEWMSAVELALLKGRHPLLRDVDVTISPSKASTFVDEKTPGKRFSSPEKGRYDSHQLYTSQKMADRNTSGKLIQQNSVDEFLTYPIDNALKQIHAKNLGDIKVNSHSRSELRKMESHHDEESTFEFNNDSEVTITNEDDEASEVLQTAEVVMNMLDVTMPSTLNDEQKKKVLSAVGRGENLMKALQGAVPEDVRGKITSAVTDIVQTHGTKLNFGELGRIRWIPDITSKAKTRIQDTVKEISVNERGYDGRNSSVDHEGRVPGDSEKFTSVSSMQENLESLEQRNSQSPGTPESGYEPNQNNYTEKTSYMMEGASDEQHKVSYSHGIIDRHTEDAKVPNDAHDIPNGEEKKPAQNEDQNMSVSASNSEQSLSSGNSISDHQVIPQEVSEFQKNDEKGGPDLLQTSNGTAEPSISVTQALDALTGFDDSTQMAVNSVFGVLEDMIDQLEKSSNEEDHEMEKGEGEGSQVISAGHLTIKSDNCERIEEKDSGSSEKSVVTTSNYKLTEVDIYPRKVMERNDSMAGEGNTLQVDSSATKISKIDPLQKYPLDINRYYWGSPYEACLQMYFASQYPRPNPSDLDMTTDLFLDPEKGQWKMLDQAASLGSDQDEDWKIPTINGHNENLHQSAKHSDTEDAIETSYVIVNPQDSKLKGQSTESIHIKGGLDTNKEATLSLVRNSLLDALKIEVGRRLSISMLDEIEEVLVDDMKLVVDMVSQAVILNHHLKPLSEIGDLKLVKFGTLEGGSTVQIISSVVEETRYLKKVLPVGVIVGSLLASLRKYFVIAVLHDEHKDYKKVGKVEDRHLSEEHTRNELYDDEKDLAHDCSSGEGKMTNIANSNNDGAMIGAVAAAVGATALFARQQQKTGDNENQVIEPPLSVNAEKGSQNVQLASPEELSQEKSPTSIVSNLAEKAMSIAGPVVPTKDDGEVDHDRLVAVLAELGQKGGLLKFVGKIALLWGGLRGAMSLTDRLISFLRIAERPLLQRIFLFGCMVLLLWSPVVVPLLPTLVQSWTMKASNVIAEYACILGLYVSSMILVVLWGKRIRGYNNPLEQYGLDLKAPRVFGFMKGLVGGMVIVMSVHSVDGLLGFASLSWPTSTSFSASPVVLVKSFINVLLLSIRGILTATGVALVEELLFRSWLIKEVEVDLGYYPSIIISGIVFSLIHWSLPSVPGFFLLSLALFGIKQRSQDKIYVPIGVRSGIMFTNFTLQTGGFIRYEAGAPSWLISSHPLHPFDGIVGLGVCFLLAILFFPKQPREKMH